MKTFKSLQDYEEFIYTLQLQFPSVKRSTLTIIRRGKYTAIAQGEISFLNGYRITIKERLSFDKENRMCIEDYGYELWHYEKKFCWYDAQPHPNEPALKVTFPHHKHILPDIRHHRVPSFDMRFIRPNIPMLIREIENLIKKL